MRIPRQASLETEAPSVYGARRMVNSMDMTRKVETPLYYSEMQRRMGAMARQESGRGEQKRSINCNKVRTFLLSLLTVKKGQ